MTTASTRETGPEIEELRRRLLSMPTLDVAEELAREGPAERAVRFRLLDKDSAIGVFEALDPVHQQELLAALREGRVRELVEAMDPDDRARLLDEMPAKVARRLLGGISPRERALTATLLGYPEESAGRIMSPEYLSLRQSMSIGEAMERIRRLGPSAETIYVLPVTDDRRFLVGIAELRDLVLAEPSRTVADVMSGELHSVTVDEDQEAVGRLMLEADLLAVPVVDREGRLVGIVTVDDAMEVLEAEDTEDLARTGAAEPLRRPYLSVTIRHLVRSRVVWLLVLIVAASLTVSVLRAFEATLEAVVALALFIPLLIGTGGNAGAQAATTMTRALAVGDIRFADLSTVLLRETRVGLLLGGVLAALGFGPITLLFDSDIAAVVCLALVTICALGTFVGSLLPLLARRLGVDPAVVSAPMVTTLVDATGLVLYFAIAQLVLEV